jgi:hypothetical protein
MYNKGYSISVEDQAHTLEYPVTCMLVSLEISLKD